MTDADTPLASALKRRILRDGPLPFHDLMHEALLHPEHGYYARGPAIGKDGDFSTSVAFEAFRLAIAKLARTAYAALGRPEGFRVVELGAGTGELAATVVAAWRAHETAPLAYVTVEPSAGLRARQSGVPGVRALARADDLAPGPSFVFGNEILDALPVRRVLAGKDGGLLEVHVDVDARTGAFRERLLPCRDARIGARLARQGIHPQPGQLLDVAPALEEVVAGAARLADPGFLVFIDYGDPAPALYAPTRLNGTLAAYRAHGKHHDPYRALGEQDLTADVDFTAVAAAATGAGLEEVGFATQQEVLEALGVHDLGLPDEARMVAGAAALGTAFHVAAFRRGTQAGLPGF